MGAPDCRARPCGGAREPDCRLSPVFAVLHAGGTLLTRTTPLRRLGVNLATLVLSAALASGCTTMRPILPSTGRLEETVRPGDKVRVVTRDGTEMQFTVTAVTADALVGEPPHGLLQKSRSITVPFSDIARIERSQFSGRKTVGAGAAAVAGAGVALGIAVGVLVIWVLTRVPGGTDGPARDAVPESPRR